MNDPVGIVTYASEMIDICHSSMSSFRQSNLKNAIEASSTLINPDLFFPLRVQPTIVRVKPIRSKAEVQKNFSEDDIFLYNPWEDSE
jgi:hypothetical protein